MAKRIVVTGVGPITSIGKGVDQLWDSLEKGKTNLVSEDTLIGAEKWETWKYHKVEGFKIEDYGLDKGKLAWIKDWKEGKEVIDLFLMMAAIKLALNDGKITDKDKKNLGLVITHENMSLTPFFEEICRAVYKTTKENTGMSELDVLKHTYKNCYKSGYDVQPFMTLFHMAKMFDIKNNSTFTCNACASGLFAIETAAEMIRAKQNKIMVVAASDKADIYKFIWFRDLKIYSPTWTIRSFSKGCDGLVFGDCGIALVLEDYDNAVKRGAHIYAEYLGGGYTLEGFQVTMPKMGSDFYHNAIKKALKSAKIDKEDVEVVVPHGVGAYVTDSYEAKAISDIFGQNKNKPVVTAFKPYVGHTLGGSALLETAILVLCMDKGSLIPTLNFIEENPQHGFKPLTERKYQTINIAMKTCSAFAGYNAAAVFKKV
jgi:3-oxoacyl-[acyl-carrier-protein] synthase II